jgi:glycosyltransferase involved in cell wall biosynthesis
VQARTRSTANPTIWQLVDSRALGGIERHIEVLSTALHQYGLAVEVVRYADYGGDPWQQRLAAEGIPLRSISGTPIALLTALWNERPALLHTHGYKAGILGRVSACLAGIPCVSTFHAGERGPFPLWLYQSIDGWTSFLAQRIAVSTQIANEIPFGAKVIANFIAAAPPRRDPPPRHVAFVGRLSHEKGPDLFCALARLGPPTISYHCYGDGPMRAALAAEYGDVVQFHGFMPSDRIWPEVGLLMMPSRAEGLPMAALEALAVGVPVAASRVGGLPDLLRTGDTGWLFEVGDTHAAAAAVTAWASLDPSQLLAMGRRCQSDVIERFGVARRLPEVLAVYTAAGFSLPARSSTTNVQSS